MSIIIVSLPLLLSFLLLQPSYFLSASLVHYYRRHIAVEHYQANTFSCNDKAVNVIQIPCDN